MVIVLLATKDGEHLCFIMSPSGSLGCCFGIRLVFVLLCCGEAGGISVSVVFVVCVPLLCYGEVGGLFYVCALCLLLLCFASVLRRGGRFFMLVCCLC